MDPVAAKFIQPVFETGQCLCAPIAKRVNYARKLKKNYEELCEKASELCNKRHDINVEVDRLKLEKLPTKVCEHWITKVGEVENKIEIIKQKFNVEKKCLRGLCPEIFGRIKLGEQVVDMISEIKDLLEKSNFQDGFLTDLPPVKVEKKPVPASRSTPSANHTLEMILNKIHDKSTPKIGIWGMGGVGKTTVMQLLNNTSEITGMFDYVIWVTVSKSWSIRKLQKEVGKRLSIETTNESNDRVASKLLEVLECKKYLLLLDDVWERVDLSVVGFPDANEENGCKVVLTTRELGACRKMGTDIEINVVVLSEKEAWEMFHSKVGKVAMSPAIKPLAEEIVTKCGGLPLALKIVSGALRKVENLNVWRNFLTELKSPATSYIEDMNEEVFKPLKVSYDHLKGIDKKNCFLYCGLYPEDHEIKKSRLIDYWRAEGLLSGKLTLAEAHVKGDAILQALIDSSLLEKCKGDDEHVKMHDVVRDLVLTMTSPKGEECTHLVRAGNSTEEMPEDEEWKKAIRISFLDNDLCNLPESPDCPILMTLLLQGNKGLEAIPESFFNNMPSLRVLDLSWTGIKSLPTSISNLTSLRSLLLKGCKNLNVLPEEMSALKGLEVLQVTWTNMAHLPLWISELTALKCLKFRFGCSLQRLIPGRRIFMWSSQTGVIGPSDENVDIVVQKLSSLTALSSLEFDFRTVSNLHHFLQNSRAWQEGTLTKFHFTVDNKNSNYSCETYCRRFRFPKYKTCLRYIGGEEGSIILPSAIEDALSRSDCFELVGHGELHTLISKSGAQTTYELRRFFVVRCDRLEYVVARNGLQMHAFPKLEYLVLHNLPNLRCIVHLEPEGLPPQLLVRSFTNLRELRLEGCSRIKKLFSSGFLIQQLYNLERLCVDYCRALEGMISEDEKIYYGALPNLNELMLIELPEFVSFFEGVPLCWSSLKTLRINRCPKLRKLPFDVNNGAALKEIVGAREWWDALEWDDNAIQLRLQPLFVNDPLPPVPNGYK